MHTNALVKLKYATLVAALTLTLAACNGGDDNSPPAATAKARNVIFFLGDGMGVATMTAARIYAVGESGQLTMDTLPELAWVRTYSNDAQVTDSAPSMAAYMTGVKMNNEVISMTANTSAYNGSGAPYISGSDSTCPATGNGTAVPTILEQAKASGRAVGAVTTTRVTHATPAVTYAHLCHRDGENAIAAQATPGGAGYNTALGAGMDVLLGGGRRHFIPSTATGSRRTDARDLTAELQTVAGGSYTYVSNRAAFDAIDPATTNKLVGLFTLDHMTFDLDRDPNLEPSLSQMTSKAIAILSRNSKGFFLMVEGGRIDHALHNTTAAKALVETVAFDNAIRGAIQQMNAIDPGLANTLIVVTADHDHTIVLNGYAKRTGATAPGNPGVLGLVKNVITAANVTDAEGAPYTVIGFGNGENRTAGARNTGPTLDDNIVSAKAYHQEAALKTAVGGETHSGTDVVAMAIGAGSADFHGFLTNTEIYGLLKANAGL